MKKKTYTIGLDYGSLSCRGILADTENGQILGEEVFDYPHGILESCLPDGTPVEGEWFLQHPGDYVDALEFIVPGLLKKSGVSPEAVVGIGIDFTVSTVVALDKQFRPLSENPQYASRLHAWTKLWKCKNADVQAERLAEVCREQNRPYLELFGGGVNPRWLLPKVLRVFEEDREIYEAADCFMEAADYVTSLLAGHPVCGCPAVASKTFWSRENGYPDAAFFRAVHGELEQLPKEQLMDHFTDCVFGYPGEKVGSLCAQMAERLGLCAGIAVSAPQMDAWAAVPGVGICAPGSMLLIIGTSSVAIALGYEQKEIPGASACLPDAHYPGLYSFVSGQASVGDGFQWFIDHLVPENYVQRAKEKGLNLHGYLTELASDMEPGETGLLALDWLNGSQAPLKTKHPSGVILGMNLQTKPEHLYLALLESTAFGARKIMENYRNGGIPVDEIVARGGIAGKNSLLMQIYADVLGVPVKVNHCSYASALGAAVSAASAAGEYTGYGSFSEAVDAMGSRRYSVYLPDEEHRKQYDLLYAEYCVLYDYFGQGKNSTMDQLAALK